MTKLRVLGLLLRNLARLLPPPAVRVIAGSWDCPWRGQARGARSVEDTGNARRYPNKA